MYRPGIHKYYVSQRYSIFRINEENEVMCLNDNSRLNAYFETLDEAKSFVIINLQRKIDLVKRMTHEDTF